MKIEIQNSNEKNKKQTKQSEKSKAKTGRFAEILLVDDDPGDVDLTMEILKRGKIDHNMTVVDDGVKAIDYLVKTFKKGEFPELKRPDLIILDLNLPRKDGRNVLKWIKMHNELKAIPVIIFTTSKAESDIERCYSSGANCYITKPVEFSDFTRVVQALESFWLNIASVPLDRSLDLQRIALATDQALSGYCLQTLLIEDDPSDVFFFKEVLGSELGKAISVTHAENIRQAVDLLGQGNFDLIVLDLGLPEARGLETLDLILPSTDGIPIVVLTGINDEKTGFEAVQRGAQDFLRKDQLDGKTLLRTLRFSFERNRIKMQERKDTEDALFQSQNRYNQFADSVFKGVQIYKDGKSITIGR